MNNLTKEVSNSIEESLMSIMMSKRNNVYYLEHCRVLVESGTVKYITTKDKQDLYWNIPTANTIFIMLGTGTSITQAAARLLSKAGVMIGFCGTSGSPLHSATNDDPSITWFSPQDEYRPTEYLHDWTSFWFVDSVRLEAAKTLQTRRIYHIKEYWCSARIKKLGFHCDNKLLGDILNQHLSEVMSSTSICSLLTAEARLIKKLYKMAADISGYGDFKRVNDDKKADIANQMLTTGNYMGYGYAASATWVLGIPHGFALMHGKTRRGGLVFDVADLIKTSIILPLAFISAMRGDNICSFRKLCVDECLRNNALCFMIDTIKDICKTFSKVN